GKFKIKLETRLLSLPEEQFLLLRLPMVFGRGSHRILSLKSAIENQQPIDVFPNIVINATHIRKLCMQVLFLINRDWSGIFHLGSTDLMHHNEFIAELCKVVHPQQPVFKRIYASNTDRYLALLPKDRSLPQHLQLTCAEVIAASAD
ncbi:MAG: dTDP-4-dehydrorhamnose reductase, partial [Flavobacteriaceae bacterium]|nr:dTDP-4-dehydrorhamnose reductase [Flavobacteriaceae bacterium]